jgi:2-dehydro-3-deoxyphosphogluconate aldolase / (4S)-4-hydroxy-2-oxoglutarate aldolase
MNPDATLEAIGRARVVAVVRADSARQAIALSAAVHRGGIRAIEIALTTPDAADAIREVRGLLPDAVVGAGTVRISPDFVTAAEAGAVFVASPGTSVDVLDDARRAGVLAIPGVLTPTEVERVVRSAPLLKLFPAGIGGPGLLRALRGPFPNVRFMPTGGVVAENVAEWLAAGAFAVGAGTDLCPPDASDLSAVEARAAAYVEAAR